MTILTSILFLAVFLASIFTISSSIHQNLPRILQVIEHRDVSQRPIRKITIGKMVPASAPQIAALPVSRMRTREYGRYTGPQMASAANNTLPLAA